MKISAESCGHAVILNLHGELTEDTLSAFEQAVERHCSDRDVVDLVLNMEEVPFVDSAALEHLLDLQDRLAENFGQVKLARLDVNVAKILEITRLDRTFECHPDVTEAVKAVRV